MPRASNTSHVEDKEFQKLMKETLRITKRQVPVELSNRLFWTIRRAMFGTKKALRSDIMTDFTASQELVLKKRGTGFKRGGKYKFGPLIYMIINKQRKRAGKSPLKGNERIVAARKEFGRRLRSVGLLRSGYSAGLAILSRLSGNSFRSRARRKIQRPSSASMRGAGSQRPEAHFAYNLNGTGSFRQRTGVPERVQLSISNSVNEEKSQMAKRIGKAYAKNIQRAAKGLKAIGIG